MPKSTNITVTSRLGLDSKSCGSRASAQRVRTPENVQRRSGDTRTVGEGGERVALAAIPVGGAI